MKTLLTAIIAAIAIVSAPANAGLFNNPISDAIGLAKNVSAGYETYNTMKRLDQLKGMTPIYVGYDTIQVNVTLAHKKPKRAEELGEIARGAICRHINEVTQQMQGSGMANANYQCGGDDGAKVAVINIEEFGESSKIGSMLAGRTHQVRVTVVDQATGKVIESYETPNLDDYSAVVEFVGFDLQTKMLKSVEPKEDNGDWEKSIKTYSQNSREIAVLTQREKKTLRKG